MPDSDTAIVVNVRVVYLARLREAFARSEERLDVPANDASVATLVATLRARGGVWADELAPGRAVRVAVNHALAAPDAPLGAGDEVALLPPVTGG